MGGCCKIFWDFCNIFRPFWFFAAISIVFNVLQVDPELGVIKEMFILVIKGAIRNTFFAGSLWFLTCLFLTEIIFRGIRCIKNKAAMIGIGILMFLIAEKGIEPRPFLEPHWLYNLDSVFYYMIFFVMGYSLFPHIVDLFELNSKGKKVFFILSGFFSLLYSALLFEGIDLMEYVVNQKSMMYIFTPIFRALIVIWLNFVVARIFEDIQVFNEIGKNTLYLCGNEWIIKSLVGCGIGILGLGLQLTVPIYIYIYTFVLLMLANRFLVPLEKKMLLSMMSLGQKDSSEKLKFIEKQESRKLKV